MIEKPRSVVSPWLLQLASAAAIVVSLLFAVISFFSTGELYRLYAHFDVELPAVTVVLLKVPAVVYLIGPALLIVAVVAKRRLIQNVRIALACDVCVAALMLAATIVYLVAMYQPVYEMMHNR